jgi:hypothetical protein
MAVAKREKARRQAKSEEQKRRNVEEQAKREAARSKTPPAPARLDGPGYHSGVKHFSRADRLELMLLQERYQHAVTKRERARADLEKHEAAYLYERGRLASAASAAEIEKVTALTELTKLHTEIEAAYDLTIAEIIFDPDTGAIAPAPKKH